MTRSIRFRVTALAALMSATFVLVVGLLMVSLLRFQLTDNLDESLSQRAATIGDLIAGTLPASLPMEEDVLVQLVNGDGRVLVSSSNLPGQRAMVDHRSGVRTANGLAGRPETFRVLARAVQTTRGGATLLVAVNLDDVTDPVGILIRLFVLAGPVVVVGFSAVAWWLTGRTLRPVESLRAEMAEITGSSPERRVSEPGTRDEIDRLASTMNLTLGRLESALRSQQRLVADASHELRGPLTSIRTALEVDLAQPAAARPMETERAVLETTIGLQRLVDDLLHLARSDAGGERVDLVRQVMDFDDVVFREARRVGEAVDVHVDVSGVSAVQVLGDATLLGHAVRNLLDNGVRHATSTVTVTLDETESGAARLSVIDDGDGVAPDDRDQIFDRFTRLDQARSRDAGGSGLGLAITREIVERHGGTVVLADSGPTRFIVDLPPIA